MSRTDLTPTVVPSRRSGRSRNAVTLQISAAALSFILVALLVVTSSRAAFVAQNDNLANTLTSATINLTDNDSNTAMFTGISPLVPGQVIDRCIDVTYTGTANPLAVRLYVPSAPTGTGLATYLNLQIDYAPDTADAFGSCTTFPASPTSVYSGTLSAFASARTSYDTAVSTWDPAATGPETRTFRFRISVQDNASAVGLNSTFGFTWETRTS